MPDNIVTIWQGKLYGVDYQVNFDGSLPQVKFFSEKLGQWHCSLFTDHRWDVLTKAFYSKFDLKQQNQIFGQFTIINAYGVENQYRLRGERNLLHSQLIVEIYIEDNKEWNTFSSPLFNEFIIAKAFNELIHQV